MSAEENKEHAIMTGTMNTAWDAIYSAVTTPAGIVEETWAEEDTPAATNGTGW